MELVLLSQEEARELRDSKSIMSVRRAHNKLKELRSMYTDGQGDNTIEVLDLSHSDFPWREYLANRSDGMLAMIIGPGVIRFEFRFVNSWDKNTNQYRADFVVIRADGGAARLHPSQNSDAHPVIGSIELWRIDAPLPPAMPAVIHTVDADAALHNQRETARSTRGRQVYEAYSQADLISRKEAQEFLLVKTQDWQSGETFCTDLTPSTLFLWRCYLGNTSWGRQLLDEGVLSFYMVWLGRPKDRAAFYVLMQDTREIVITPGQKPEMKPQDVSLIRWNM